MIGASIPRFEDEPLLRGEGRFVDDLRTGDEAFVVFVRSMMPAGRILTLGTGAAAAMPGVLAVLTARDMAEAGLRMPPPVRMPPGLEADAVHVPRWSGLADGAVHFVGEPIAAVVAESLAQAMDAAEAVEVDIDERPAAADLAAAHDAPLVWPDASGNRVFFSTKGDEAGVAQAIASAEHIVSQRLSISRVSAAPIEPRAARASFDAESGSFTLHAATQSTHSMSVHLARVFGLPARKMRVVSLNCGGSFGMRNYPVAEHLPLLLAAQRLGRPVLWRQSRSETFLSDPHAREQVVDATLALDGDGRITALKVEIAAAVGAYVTTMTLTPSFSNLGSLAGVYTIPAISVRLEGIHLNTQSLTSYRGAGRPEATYVIERMIDIAAARLGRDRVALRRINLIRPAQMPYANPLGFTYDSGDFPALLDRSLALADWTGVTARRAASRQAGRLRGIGLCFGIEIAGGPAGTPNPEFARIELSPEGCVMRLGSGDSGQGHATVFRQILFDALGVAPDRVRFVSGDTGQVARGTGTFGSRSVTAAGTALLTVAGRLRARLIEEATAHFGVQAGQVAFRDGLFAVVGSNRRIDAAELVAARGLALADEVFVSATAATYPNGCHIAEVEIDPETGALKLVAYTAVEDLGTEINPMLTKAQIHGGIVQGLGQAMIEELRYEPETGQLLTGSFMDYAMPRAGDLPLLTVENRGTATASNPLGAKGAGESGVVGALPALISAVCDALRIEHLDMPATPCAVWTAIRHTRESQQIATD